MGVKGNFLKEVIVIIFLSSVAVSVAVRNYGFCGREVSSDTFKCSDGTLIDRTRYCDRINDCKDNSDEDYCGDNDNVHAERYLSYPNSSATYTAYKSPYPAFFARCGDNKMYYPVEWICDGIVNCPDRSDEYHCGNRWTISLNTKRRKAIEWIQNKTLSASATRKWGPLVHKTAVILYLSDSHFVNDINSVRREIAYELTIQFLSRISQKRILEISSSDLAAFIHSFLVTCINPRDFHGFNLVEELRKRVEKQSYTNPYLLLALCNAGDTITESDVKNLSDIFWSNNRELWTDTQAIALMALSCARNQPESIVDSQTISELALELKNRQYRNGTVENLLSTLLVMQALYSAETDEDPDNFDERKALSYIMQNQKQDGSFGNFLLTYYALPVLTCKSMVDISDSHCTAVPKDEDTSLFDLINHLGPKIHVRYSILIGMDKDVERTLMLNVPANTSFYGVMELAAEIDSKYKFEYVVRNRKPYISVVSGIVDDSETGQFWFPYTVKDEIMTPVKASTADMIPQADDHIVMWYRKGSWIK